VALPVLSSPFSSVPVAICLPATPFTIWLASSASIPINPAFVEFYFAFIFIIIVCTPSFETYAVPTLILSQEYLQ
jgi:hypothetical protein